METKFHISPPTPNPLHETAGFRALREALEKGTITEGATGILEFEEPEFDLSGRRQNPARVNCPEVEKFARLHGGQRQYKVCEGAGSLKVEIRLIA